MHMKERFHFEKLTFRERYGEIIKIPISRGRNRKDKKNAEIAIMTDCH